MVEVGQEEAISRTGTTVTTGTTFNWIKGERAQKFVDERLGGELP